MFLCFFIFFNNRIIKKKSYLLKIIFESLGKLIELVVFVVIYLFYFEIFLFMKNCCLLLLEISLCLLINEYIN